MRRWPVIRKSGHPGSHARGSSAGWRRYLATGDDEALRQRLEISAVRRDGMVFPVEVRISPVEIDGQRFFSVFLHDITNARPWPNAARKKR
ncbi:PAS domain-containing protein [Pseudomonas sp. PCH446]